ncbi:MAG: cytochrome P450 [Myxococcales bacterium]|nr:cytochrome P450 [Myxococcales bacterium]
MTPVPDVGGLRAWNTWRILRAPLRTYSDWRARHGDTYQVPAINGDVVVTCDSEVVRDLYRAATTEVEPFAVDVAEPLVGRGSLLLLKGEAHGRERKLLMPPFHGERMRAYGQVIRDIAERRLAAVPQGRPFRVADVMLDISLDVIVQAVFGIRQPDQVQRWAQAVQALVVGMHPLLLFMPFLQRRPFPGWGRFERSRSELDRMLYAEIARRRSEEPDDDILSLMLHASYEDGQPMSDEAVRDELVTLLFAGHETTQISMAWGLYHVCRSQPILQRLQAELDATDGSPEALAKAPYLDAVVQETLRLDPVVPDMVRTLSVDLQLGPYALAAGTHIAPAAVLVHAREDLYPEARRFRPERFEECRPRPWEFLPFGGGVRRCIGAALATYEMKLVLGTWLRGAHFRSTSADEPARRNITMGAKRGVPMELVRWRSEAGRQPAVA